MIDSLRLFVEAWELFRDPTLAGTFAGAALGVVGVWIVLRRMVFLSAALSQVAGFGVAAAFWIHGVVSSVEAMPSLAAIVVTVGAALTLSRRSNGADTELGLLFLGASAGTLAIGSRITAELNDIDALLFGSAVAVLPEEFRFLAAVCAVLVVLHAWWWRGFAAVTADRDDARVRGLPVRVLEGVLVASAAVGVAVATRVLGALPAFAFSVLPGVGALAVARSVRQALWIAGLLGAFAGFFGYLAAFLFDLPVGPAQTLVGLATTSVCVLAGRVFKR